MDFFNFKRKKCLNCPHSLKTLYNVFLENYLRAKTLYAVFAWHKYEQNLLFKGVHPGFQRSVFQERSFVQSSSCNWHCCFKRALFA